MMPKLKENKTISLANWQKVTRAQFCLGNAFGRQSLNDLEKVHVVPLYSSADIQSAMQVIADMYDFKIQFQEK